MVDVINVAIAVIVFVVADLFDTKATDFAFAVGGFGDVFETLLKFFVGAFS